MHGEIISIGTELLLGDVENTNASYLAKILAQKGIDLFYITCVGDNYDRLVETIQMARTRSQIIFTTGGLGPTSDDITRKAIAKAFSRPLILNEDARQMIEDFFSARGVYMPKENLNQAYYPQGGTLLFNSQGTAPGIFLDADNTRLFALPGVPHEMQRMVSERVLPILEEFSGGSFLQSLLVRIYGLGESVVEHRLQDIIAQQSNPTVALLAGTGEVFVRITCKETSSSRASALIDEVLEQVKQRIGQYIYGYDEDTLETVVARHMQKEQKTVAVAESCSGGLLAHRLTNIPGSSSFFQGGIVSYSDASKMSLLQVSEEILLRHGAVSEEVALAMARGVQKRMGSHIGLGITGIAGPQGGTEKKPVGTVCFGIITPHISRTETKYFPGERVQVKYRSTNHALHLLANNL